MASKKDERHQLTKAAEKSESHPLRPSTGGGSTEKPLKRSVPEEHRHNTQAPVEKRAKQKGPTDAVKGITPVTKIGMDQAR